MSNSWVSRLFSSASPSAFGVNITDKSLPSDLELVKGTIQKTNKKYREEFSKYREIAKFNQQLSTGYMKNLEAMVDVSKVLNYYVDIFNTIKEEYAKNEELLGPNMLKAADIAYLENLTRSKIDQLNRGFLQESDKLKKIYQQFGKEAEIAKVTAAQQNLAATTDMANATYRSLRNSTAAAAGGGSKAKRAASKAKAAPKAPAKNKKGLRK